MAIEYTVHKKNEYLLVHSNATTDNPEELLEFIDNIIAECDKHEVNKLLLDNRDLTFEREFTGTYELAVKCIDKMEGERTMKIALIARPERMEFARVYETIGLTRGFEIKAFERPKLASVWLLT